MSKQLVKSFIIRLFYSPFLKYQNFSANKEYQDFSTNKKYQDLRINKGLALTAQA
jgi:hypothetical protein